MGKKGKKGEAEFSHGEGQVYAKEESQCGRVDGGGTRLAREARAAAQAATAEDAVARDAATALRMQRQAKRAADKQARGAV